MLMTLVSLNQFLRLKKKPRLCKPKKRLHSCNSEKLNICGMFTVTLAGKKKFEVQDIYAVKDLHQPLLGGPALEALDLIKKNCVNAVNSEEKTDTEYRILNLMQNHLLAMYPEK